MKADFQPLRTDTRGQPGRWQLPLVVAILLGLGILGAILWLGPPTRENRAPPVPAELPPLRAEDEAYLNNIEIGGMELSRWQNFLGQEVIYLDARLSNRGPRTILALELTLEFKDIYGRVVLRETLRPVGGRRPSRPDQRAPPLAAGETRSFRAAFENMPLDWNRALPQIMVTGLLLQ